MQTEKNHIHTMDEDWLNFLVGLCYLHKSEIDEKDTNIFVIKNDQKFELKISSMLPNKMVHL